MYAPNKLGPCRLGVVIPMVMLVLMSLLVFTGGALQVWGVAAPMSCGVVPTEIYISGTVDLTGGGVINSTADPANLIILSTGVDIHMRGGSGFYGTVVAPDTDV